MRRVRGARLRDAARRRLRAAAAQVLHTGGIGGLVIRRKLRPLAVVRRRPTRSSPRMGCALAPCRPFPSMFGCPAPPVASAHAHYTHATNVVLSAAEQRPGNGLSGAYIRRSCDEKIVILRRVILVRPRLAVDARPKTCHRIGIMRVRRRYSLRVRVCSAWLGRTIFRQLLAELR